MILSQKSSSYWRTLYSFVYHFVKKKAAVEATKAARPAATPPLLDFPKLQVNPPTATLATDDKISLAVVDSLSVLKLSTSSISGFTSYFPISDLISSFPISDFISYFPPYSNDPFSATRDSYGASWGSLTTFSWTSSSGAEVSLGSRISSCGFSTSIFTTFLSSINTYFGVFSREIGSEWDSSPNISISLLFSSSVLSSPTTFSTSSFTYSLFYVFSSLIYSFSREEWAFPSYISLLALTEKLRSEKDILPSTLLSYEISTDSVTTISFVA